mmetsp:Transcript_64719/g.146010  ORF Transcript_64719/g.146010 Transcript_64719/m.146010 type:complete len:136 (-) Transcript_64719:107-514(-)
MLKISDFFLFVGRWPLVTINRTCAVALLPMLPPGRAMHLLELGHLAAEWYTRALEIEAQHVRPLVASLRAAEAKAATALLSAAEPLRGGDRELTADEAEASSVAAEAAHNLALMYETSGNAKAASQVARSFFPLI